MKVAAPLILLLAMFVPSAADGHDPLSSYRWKNRVLVLSASSSDDVSLVKQRAVLASDRSGCSERELVAVEILGEQRAKARKDLRLGEGFSAVLIGKDGGVKLRSDKPVTLDELYALIDAMPMRQREARESK